MNKLEYCFDCLDGHYFLTAQWDETLSYEIESDIPGFMNRSGDLSEEETKAFVNELKKAKIGTWDRDYLPEGEGIEDAVRWKLVLIEEGREYVSKGEESFEPYGYESFVEALKQIEDKADYFKAGIE